MRIVALFTVLLGALGAQPPSGSVERGQAIFDGKGGCLDCHAVAGAGSRFGPDLTDIGSRAGAASSLRGRSGRGALPPDPTAPGRGQAELERSILDPDAEILPQNRTIRVVTRDGAAITGRLLNQDTFSLQLIDSKERMMSLEKSSLREYGFVKASPMPSYRDKLSAQELSDLVAYLLSLKGIRK